MKKVQAIIISGFIIAVISINFSIIRNNSNDGNLSLSYLKHAFADENEDPCQPGCPTGFVCVGGVCVQQEQPTRVSCQTYCWWKFQMVPGHKTTCPKVPGGVTNCSGNACEPDPGAC